VTASRLTMGDKEEVEGEASAQQDEAMKQHNGEEAH
jgi:hypothetical protein